MTAVAACFCVLVVGALAVLHYQASGQGAGGSDQGGSHSAARGTNSQFSVRIDGVQRQANPAGLPAPPSDRHYVTVAVSFENHSSGQQRADPRDFSLQDARGETQRPTFAADPGSPCARWGRADLHPAGDRGSTPRDAGAEQVGTTFGPKTLCFVAGGAPSGSLTLVWEPDVSIAFLSRPTRITLN
jgi:Domain of unknown function (DUF4352)